MSFEEEVKRLFAEYSKNYDIETHRQVWATHRNTFHIFWKSKILGDEPSSPEADYDPIIKLIDVKARGFDRETDEAIARVNLPQGTWYRIFNDLREKKKIRTILDKIFKTEDEFALVKLVNDLSEVNEKNKNGLTGEKAAALNALIFLNNPNRYLSCVSLGDRYRIIEKFNLPMPAQYETYGEKVIFSNRDIIFGFKMKYQIDAWPRLLSNFLYSANVEHAWKGDQTDQFPTEVTEISPESEFALEKHLEDFLVAN
jgi:hypothetical protein